MEITARGTTYEVHSLSWFVKEPMALRVIGSPVESQDALDNKAPRIVTIEKDDVIAGCNAIGVVPATFLDQMRAVVQAAVDIKFPEEPLP